MSTGVGVESLMMKGTKAMTTRRRAVGIWMRRGLRLGVLGLLLAAMGDRAAAVAARGIDPLDVLNLQVKPNVIVVLDSSGSMQETTGSAAIAATDTNTGDNPRSKMYLAKQVLKQVMADNANHVTFLFGQYTQSVYDPFAATNPSVVGTRMPGNDPGGDRFRYVTDDQAFPSMTTTELYTDNESDGSASRGLQAWQDIRPAWNTLYYSESNGVTTKTCSVVVAAAATFFGAGGPSTTAGTMAAALKTAMEGCTGRPGTPNTYNVTHSAANGTFTFGRATGTNTWTLLWSNATTAISRPLNARTNFTVTGITRAGNTATVTVTLPAGNANTGLAVGGLITISGINEPEFNGTFPIASVPSTTTFTYTLPAVGTTNATLGGTPRALGWADRTFTTTAFTTQNSIRLLRRSTNSDWQESYDYNGDGTAETVTTYYLTAGRLFNGETLNVTSGGRVCGFGTTQALTNPPTVFLQQVASCGGANSGTAVKFTFAGSSFGSNSISCNGFQSDVPLVRCDTTGAQFSLVTPLLENELPYDTTANTLKNYTETSDGVYAVPLGSGATLTPRPGVTGGIKADGSTPIANSLRDIRDGNSTFVGFGTSTTTGLWGAGQTTPTAITAIKTHSNPKERTIVIFVTDGDDTCAAATDDDSSGDANDERALAAAYRAQLLYTRIDPAESASSVTTYVVGFGSGAQTNRLNWIAWGGSGMGQPGPATVTNDGTRWTPTGANAAAWGTTLSALRAKCSTCQDAYIAPDAQTLAAILQSILDQGATAGEFTATASTNENVFEWSGEVSGTFATFGSFNPNNPHTRFAGVVPTIFRTSFELPGFKGHFKAITNEGVRWDAGQILHDAVLYGPGNGTTSGLGGTSTCLDDGIAGHCTFASATNVIKRHIYTTSHNGVFPVGVSQLTDSSWIRTPALRLDVWPPSTVVDTAAGSTGYLDARMGLTAAAMDFNALRSEFGACMGTPLPANCCAAPLTGGCTVAASATQNLDQARKEARQIILAYMAGAEAVLDANSDPTRIAIGGNKGEIVYQARSWMLGDSTLSEAAIAPPPIEDSPDATGFGLEYRLMRDGIRTIADDAVTDPDIGFGVRNPDLDRSSPTGNDSRTAKKPTMTMVYLPANDMLHAFRAGSSVATTGTFNPASPNCTRSPTVDCGGEEAWAFLPFDQIDKLRLRMRPQTRATHTYMMAGPARLTDVFIPNTSTIDNYTGATTTYSLSGSSTGAMKGLWRRVILFGRGIGGKYITALDVTAPGPYTRTTKDTGSNAIVGPIPLWSRGNPDTWDGTTTGTPSYSSADSAAYAKMGETWSTPAIGFVNKMPSERKPCAGTSTRGQACADQSGGGVSFVAFVGSGYCSVNASGAAACGASGAEGRTLFTLDILTGDVISDVDVGAGTISGGYENAIVAGPASFIPEAFVDAQIHHPLNAKVPQLYVPDLHGRVWKFQTSNMTSKILFADLRAASGSDQPIGTQLTLGRFAKSVVDSTTAPFVFGVTGNDSRTTPTTARPFKGFAYRDDDAAPSATVAGGTLLFLKDLCEQPTCLQSFRGTVQPAAGISTNSTGQSVGRVFFGGTRFVAPPPESTLSTPISTSGVCRSRFDSIFFALGAESGLAAYDLNIAGSDEYVLLDDSKISGVSIIATPDGSKVHIDEGLNSSAGGLSCGGAPPKGTLPNVTAGTSVATGTMRPVSSMCRQ
jgi:hypothetical protein